MHGRADAAHAALQVLALGSAAGPPLRVPCRSLPPGLACLSLLNAQLVAAPAAPPPAPRAIPPGSCSQQPLPPGLHQLSLKYCCMDDGGGGRPACG
jgi:hypothetical protein